MTLRETAAHVSRPVAVDIHILPGLACSVPPRPTRMHRQQSGTTPICFPPAHPIPLAWLSDRVSPTRGCQQIRSRRRMHMRRTVGVSLAFAIIAASATAKTPEKSLSHHPGQQHGAKPQKALRIGKPQPVSSRGAYSRSFARHPEQHIAEASVTDDSGGPPDRYLTPAREFGASEIGKAAWYNLVGGYTSTGERLDTVTATAAHRT